MTFAYDFWFIGGGIFLVLLIAGAVVWSACAVDADSVPEPTASSVCPPRSARRGWLKDGPENVDAEGRDGPDVRPSSSRPVESRLPARYATPGRAHSRGASGASSSDGVNPALHVEHGVAQITPYHQRGLLLFEVRCLCADRWWNLPSESACERTILTHTEIERSLAPFKEAR